MRRPALLPHRRRAGFNALGDRAARTALERGRKPAPLLYAFPALNASRRPKKPPRYGAPSRPATSVPVTATSAPSSPACSSR